MSRDGFTKLTHFLTQLEENKIQYTLAHYRDEAIMVLVAIPGERWEIEFFQNGLVEIERFKSTNGIEDEVVLSQLFAAYEEAEPANNIPASTWSS